MLKAVAVAPLFVLASCSPLPWPPQPLPGPAYQAQVPQPSSPAPAHGRAVRYVGRGEGGRIAVDLVPLTDGRTRAEGSVSGTGGAMCMGTFSGDGMFLGRTMQVREKSLPGCVVNLTRVGRTLTVDAGGRECVALSGPSCSLSGSLTQR